MLRCASSFVIAAYAKVRLIPQDSRALPAAFLRSRPIFTAFQTFYEFIIIGQKYLLTGCRNGTNYHLKVANESLFLLNINMLPNLSFTNAKHYY